MLLQTNTSYQPSWIEISLYILYDIYISALLIYEKNNVEYHQYILYFSYIHILTWQQPLNVDLPVQLATSHLPVQLATSLPLANCTK